MELRKLVVSKEPLGRLMSSPLPINIAWALSKIVKLVNNELVSFEEVKFNKIKEMGESFQKDGREHFKVLESNMERFQLEINELLNEEPLMKFKKIKLKELVSYKDANGNGIQISAEDLMFLDWLIEE